MTRFRRHIRPPNRRLLRDLGVIAAVATIGFIAAALWLSPVPVVATEREVPRLLGHDLDAARRELSALGYRVRIGDAREHPSARRGVVIAQDPPPTVAMPQGGTVEIVPSAGPAEAPVPDVVGLDAALASKILAAAGLRVGVVDSVLDRRGEIGTVLGTRPSAGAGRRSGEAVDLIVNARP